MAKKAESGGYARLKGDLAQKTPGSFYVLYGEEDYLRRYYLSMLRRQTRERKDLVIIGPAPASIGRINDMFRQIAYFKSPDETLLMRLRGWMELFCQKNEDKMRSLLVYYDMDPVHGY